MPADDSREASREFARLRGLMARPGTVQLLHTARHMTTWLCDDVVLADVTGSPAVSGLEDGFYRLQANKGLILKEGLGPTINLPIYLGRIRQTHWLPVTPTIWSLTDNQAKAMLLYAEVVAGMLIPLAMNQEVWQAYLASYPDARLYHSGDGGPFLVATPAVPERAYIQPIRIPEGAQAQACALVYATEREKNGEADTNPVLHRPRQTPADVSQRHPPLAVQSAAAGQEEPGAGILLSRDPA